MGVFSEDTGYIIKESASVGDVEVLRIWRFKVKSDTILAFVSFKANPERITKDEDMKEYVVDYDEVPRRVKRYLEEHMEDDLQLVQEEN